jgi:peptidylprolyl isomerase
MKRIALIGLLLGLFGVVFPGGVRSGPVPPKYRDGTYLGISRSGPFQAKVKVMVYDGVIGDVEFLEISDWKPDEVRITLRRRILEKQSEEVDGVSGATISSDLIKQAAGDALKNARLPRPAASPVVPAEAGATSPQVVLETTQGEIVIALFPAQAPRAVENFLGLVNKGYYNGTVFHRVIRNFMIQGGDPTATGRGGESVWGKPFADEFSPTLAFDRVGLLAMANAGANSNGSQFFITVGKTPWLNNHHTIFGEVVSGFSAVEALSRVATGPADRPLEGQKIIKAYQK